MILVEMSSCTRKMYGGGIEVQLRRKKRILEVLEKRKSNGNKSQTLQNQIKAAENNVANYEQKYQNKIKLYPLEKPSTSILGSFTSAIGNIVGPVNSATAANAQAKANAAAQAAKAEANAAAKAEANAKAAENLEVSNEIATGVGKLFGNAQAEANAKAAKAEANAKAAENLKVSNEIATGVGKLFGNAQAAANAANAIKQVNHSKKLLKVAAQNASKLAKNLEKLANNMSGGKRRSRRTRRRRTHRRRN